MTLPDPYENGLWRLIWNTQVLMKWLSVVVVRQNRGGLERQDLDCLVFGEIGPPVNADPFLAFGMLHAEADLAVRLDQNLNVLSVGTSNRYKDCTSLTISEDTCVKRVLTYRPAMHEEEAIGPCEHSAGGCVRATTDADAGRRNATSRVSVDDLAQDYSGPDAAFLHLTSGRAVKHHERDCNPATPEEYHLSRLVFVLHGCSDYIQSILEI